MSRSRKRTPVIGHTCAKSDQPWKAGAARAFRHAAAHLLRAEGDDALLPMKRWSRVNPWDAPKDGKRWVGHGEARWLRK